MMDQMSQEPGPTRNEACQDLYISIKISTNNTHPDSRKYKSLSDDFIMYIVKKEVYKHQEGELGSQAGWVCFYRNHLLETIYIKIKKYTATKRRIQILVRCMGSFMLLYQKVLEKRYAPEGAFEVESSKYWNPLLWNLNKQNTIKYRNAMNQHYNLNKKSI